MFDYEVILFGDSDCMSDEEFDTNICFFTCWWLSDDVVYEYEFEGNYSFSLLSCLNIRILAVALPIFLFFSNKLIFYVILKLTAILSKLSFSLTPTILADKSVDYHTEN